VKDTRPRIAKNAKSLVISCSEGTRLDSRHLRLGLTVLSGYRFGSKEMSRRNASASPRTTSSSTVGVPLGLLSLKYA
jgi:hypothetical protein